MHNDLLTEDELRAIHGAVWLDRHNVGVHLFFQNFYFETFGKPLSMEYFADHQYLFSLACIWVEALYTQRHEQDPTFDYILQGTFQFYRWVVHHRGAILMERLLPESTKEAPVIDVEVGFTDWWAQIPKSTKDPRLTPFYECTWPKGLYYYMLIPCTNRYTIAFDPNSSPENFDDIKIANLLFGCPKGVNKAL
jgi:hypothetical protein